MAFPKSVPSSWIVRSVASVNKHLSDLKPFEFGIFDKDTHLSLSAADIAKRRNVYLAAGSPNVSQFKENNKIFRNSNINNSDLSFRTEEFPVKNVDLLRAQEPVTSEKTNVYYLGFNGLDTCESLKFECGKTYQFHVEAKGRVVRTIFGNDFREIIEFTTDCCDDCTQTGCEAGEDCHKYIDALVERFNTGLWISRFFTAEKVIACDELPTGLTETSFNKFCLTVCDNGNEIDLSKVQNQYPTLTVTRTERVAPYSTYEVTKTGGVPSAFSQSSVTLHDCSTCPSGFTVIPSGYAYIVEIDNANPEDALAAVQAVWATAISATLVKFANGVSEYYVIASAPLSAPAAGVDAAIALDLGFVDIRCQGPATTTDWVACGTTYKVQRDLCLTLANDDCDATDDFDGAEVLARLTAAAAGWSELVPGTLALDDTSTKCLLRFTASQYNNAFLEDGCDTIAVAKFNDLPTFEGARWVVCPCEGWTVNEAGCPVPPVASDRCCQCGIKITGRPTDYLLDQFCGYDFATYLEKDPIELRITAFRDDEDTDICTLVSPSWLHAQRATYRQLRGDEVIKRIITDRFYNQELWVNQTDKTNQLFLQREGIKLGVDINKFYFAVDVYFNTHYTQNVNASHSDIRNMVTLFVNQDDVLVFDQLKSFLGGAFQEAEIEF